MVFYEEIFQFAYEFLTQIFDVTNVGESAVIPRDGHDAVIAFRVFLLALFSLDNSHHAALQQAADGAGSSMSASTSTGSPAADCPFFVKRLVRRVVRLFPL